MIRNGLGKVMWVGRATVFLVGLAVILALVFGMASTAFGANGQAFLLGKKNVASAISTLVKQGPGPALNLVVGAGQPPLQVNATAGKATNLNSDKLDGKDSTGFLGSTAKAQDSDKLDGKDSGDFVQNTGEMTFGVFDSWMSSHSPSDPVTVDYRGTWTTFTREAGAPAQSEVRLVPPLPTSVYGKGMLLTGMEICYNTSDAAVSLSRVKLIRQTDGAGDFVVDDSLPTDGSQCHMYRGTPQLMGTDSNALLEMHVNWSEKTAPASFSIMRTTFFLQPSDTAAAALPTS